MSGHAGGLEGGLRPPLEGCRGAEPPVRGSGGSAPGKKFFFFLGKHDTYLGKRVMYLGGFFGTWFLPMVFYFRLRN
jgi:hypothetical protein